jgi:hypothetical protein
MAWTGYRASKSDLGGLQNGYITPKAKQAWSIGDVVKVGFVNNLEVIKKNGAIYVLWQAEKNRFYSFQPHMGICRHESLAEALAA